MTKKTKHLFSFLFTFLALASLVSAQDISPSKQSFWQDVDIDYNFSLSSFSGNFDRYENVIGISPFPVNGVKGNVSLAKPLPHFYGIPSRVRMGLSVMNYSSKTTLNRDFDFSNAIGEVAPMNVNNIIFGPELGLSFDIGINNVTFSPGFGLGLYRNNPRTDGFINSNGSVTRGSVTNKFTRDFSLNTGTMGTGLDENIPSYIGAAMLEGRLTFNIAGTEYFINYTYKRFLNSYFDGVRDISTEKGSNFAMLTGVGVRVPIKRGVRNSQVGTDLSAHMRFLRKNMDDGNQSHLDIFFNTFDDLVFDRNTIGLNRNYLATKVQIVEVPLGNTSMKLELAKIPSSTFVIGNVDEDPFQIQNYGRIRVAVQDFYISRTTITNKHYRLFLLAMGHNFAGSNRLEELIIDTSPTLNEVIKAAELSGVNLPEGIDLVSIDGLLPDEHSWNSLNLNHILSFDEYFYSQEFDDYPVVGVNWYQARLFAGWAGLRLPNEVEWEYAAKSGVGGRTFPWEGYSAQNSNGEYLANYMQGRGIYNLDGYTLLAPARSFQPNEFGLYNMAGNVSEWVADSYSSTYQVLRRDHIMVTPSNVDFNENRKIHRGGSWASTLFYIGSGVRNFQNGDVGSPTIGFRVAASRLGKNAPAFNIE